jgi:hypothetical protein
MTTTINSRTKAAMIVVSSLRPDSNDDSSDDLKGTRLFSPKKENAHQKRARAEVREAAEVNEETPRKRSRLNSGPNNDASDSAVPIGLGDESNHFSTRVEPAQIDAKHAWDKKKCMGEAADRVKKECEFDYLHILLLRCSTWYMG